ncbi:MAG: hypothetical protein ABIQ88_06125 [Chitinophagaceae bacterium]
MGLRKPLPEDFECEAAYAPQFYDNQGLPRLFTNDQIKNTLSERGISMPDGLGNGIVPVALRWRVSQEVGLPITPFYVWRKLKKTSLPATPVNLSVHTGRTIFLNGPFYRLLLVLSNNTPTDISINITTLNNQFQDTGSKTFPVNIAASGSANLLIDHPNVSAVRIPGVASIKSATGISMLQYVNDPDWKQIQIVGLPVQPGIIAPDLYAPDKQGFINSLTSAEKAAVQRTDLYTVFTKPSPVTAPDGAAIPPFKTPSGNELLSAYNQLSTDSKGVQSGTLLDIGEMLDKVYKKAPALLLGTQKNYLKEIKSLGVVDPANPGPVNNGTYQNPVCSTTLLSATTDCWHALGLGFGTLDFLPFRLGAAGTPSAVALPRGELHAFDYMVSASFRMPVIELDFQFPGVLKNKWKGFEEIEYATLCHFDVQQPPAPAALQADTVSQNRPLRRDDFFYEQVRLSWVRPAIQDRSPVSFAIAFKNNVTGAPIQFLNSNRPFIGKPQPFMPSRRIDKKAADPPGRDGSGFLRFFHDRSPVPFIGSITEKYYVASQNVFGLWSAWVLVPHTLNAKPPQLPRIVSAAFTPAFEGITTHIYPARLDAVISYDWEDRTPFEIQLAGYFLSAPAPDPPVVTPGIVLSNAGGTIEKYRVRFSGDSPQLFKLNAMNLLVAVAQAEGEVIADPVASSGTSSGLPTTANPEMRTYRVKLKMLQLNFTSQSKLWFAIYANGTELKNPAIVSPYSKPIVINTADPLPRVPPVFAPDIKWASLPDAGNTSRFHLKFAPVAGVKGYAVYLATELSLRDRLKDIVYPAGGSIFQRRDAINGASAANKKAALDAFTRVNKKMLELPEIELEMNGDTQGLFVYAVSSFTDQAAESKLSDWIYVAVPERIAPAPPVLTGFINKKLVLPKAILQINPGAGNNTATLEIFRTTKQLITSDVNMMGLPASTGPAIGWTKFRINNGVEEPVVNPADKFDFYRLEDNVAPGWAPYFYRAVGIGLNQPNDGKMPGRSSSSNLLELLPPVPAEAPHITDAAATANAALTQLRIFFKTDAYVGNSPHGLHTIFISRLNSNGGYDIIEGAEIPRIAKLATGNPEPLNKLVRLQKDNNGLSAYALNLPIEAQASFKITVTDPLGRKADIILPFAKPLDTVVITELLVRRLAGQVNVGFKTNIGKALPPSGRFMLTISVRKGLVRRTMLSIAMNTIPNSLPPLFFFTSAIAGGGLQGADRLYTYGAVFKGAVNLMAFSSPVTVIVEITNPAGVKTSKEVNI